MAEKNPIDFQKMIEQGTKVTSLQDLQQKGFQKVKVLDEQTIQRLITQAVDRVVNTQTAEERESLLAQSRHELDRLLREQRESKSRAQLLETDKQSLVEQVEALQKELSLALDVQGETVHKKVQEITAAMRKHVEETNRRSEAAQQEVVAAQVEIDRLKEEQAKVAADLEAASGDADRLQEDLRKRDAEMADLRKELSTEQEKNRTVDDRIANMEWQVKDAKNRLEAGLKEGKQAREDYNRINTHNIRLMAEVQSLRAGRGAAAPVHAPAPAPSPALAQLKDESKKESPAGGWKFMVAKIPPVAAKGKEAAAVPISVPDDDAWELVTVVREPDGSCLCFFKAPLDTVSPGQ